MFWLKKLFTKNSSDPLALKLYAILGFFPDDILGYKKALTHSSLEHPTIGNNERLEFLGDSILDAVITEYLFVKLPHKNEGVLTDMKSKMVSRRTLNSLAKEFQIDQIIQTKLGGKIPNSILGNAFEALIAAIYLDKGRKTCEEFIINNIIQKHFNLDEIEKQISSYKKHFIHWTQKNNKKFYFKLIQESGESHQKKFQIALFIEDEKIATATSGSKKKAEEETAKKACNILNI